MKTEKKFTWIFRYFNTIEGVYTYRTHEGLTVEEAKQLAKTYLKHNKNYQIFICKLYKKF